MDTERRLLIRLFDEIRCVDPDFLIFHGAFGYQMDVLLHRAESLRVPNWSGLGRLKRHSMPKKVIFVTGYGLQRENMISILYPL